MLGRNGPNKLRETTPAVKGFLMFLGGIKKGTLARKSEYQVLIFRAQNGRYIS